MSETPLTIQELARLIQEFTKQIDVGAHNTRLHTFENFANWLIENDTSKNPHRYEK